MKILILTHSFIRYKTDIAGIFLFSLYKELQVKKDVEVIVLAPHESNLPLAEKINGIKIYRFRYAPIRFERLAYKGNMHEMVIKNFLNKLLFISFIISFALNTFIVVKREKVNFIHAHWWIPSGIIALLTSLFLKKPYVLTTHGTDAFLIRKFKFIRALGRLTFRKANMITAVSNSIKSTLVDTLRIDPNKIEVFPMPCDFSIFHPITIKKRQKGIILSIGRLIEEKGYEYLIEAIGFLKKREMKVKLIIIGEGPKEDELKEKIQKLNLDKVVEIFPFKPKAELNYFYNLCDVFVLPSITTLKGEKEGFGLVLLEAMACKKPVIGTNSGGIPDIIKHGKTGLLVPEKNSHTLADAIERLLKDKKLATQFAENGYKYAIENFTPQKTAEKMLKVYSEAFFS